MTFEDAQVKEVVRDEAGVSTAAVLLTENITVLIFAERGPVTSKEVLAEYGLNLDDYQILVVKQGYLTPELYSVAKKFIMALTPGNCAQKLTLAEYKNVRRPMEPLEPVTDPKRITEAYDRI